jgi:hypothetical protein
MEDGHHEVRALLLTGNQEAAARAAAEAEQRYRQVDQAGELLIR